MARAIKRALDLLVALVLLLALLPVMIAIALLVKFSSPGPVFFVQERAGRHGRTYHMRKFRTMVSGAHQGAGVHRDDPRITAVGRWLRRSSLDELPQLWHVLVGEMSLVGPRSAPLHVVARMRPGERRRMLVRPGLTGWAQVTVRNSVPWSERIKLDLWYVENWSLWLDLKILWRTAGAVLGGRGLTGPDGCNRGYQNRR